MRMKAAKLGSLPPPPTSFLPHPGATPTSPQLHPFRHTQRDPAQRFTLDDIKAHPWFASIDWIALDARELTPPFKPNITGETDIRYFETEFTREQPRLTPDSEEEEMAAAVPEGEGFDGFTFVDAESHLRDDAEPSYTTAEDDGDDGDDGVVVTGGW